MILMILFITNFCVINAQFQAYIYRSTPLDVYLNNPERGFVAATDSPSTSLQYNSLDPNFLLDLRNKNITLIARSFSLDAFLNSPIRQEYLNGIQLDFSIMRQTGVKAYIGFQYSSSIQPTDKWDTNKAQMLAHIAQLKPILQANADVIAFVQAGFIGVWGEWAYTNNFGYPFAVAADFQNRRQVLEALLDAVPSTRMILIRYPQLKNQMYGSTRAITESEAHKETILSRLGYHNDCFLSSQDDVGTYQDIPTEYPFMEQETKYLPIGGETCAVFAPRTQCPTAQSEMQRFHYSFLNIDYHPDVIASWKRDGCFVNIQNRMGYRYELVNAAFPSSVSLRQPQLTFLIRVINNGFATIYNKRIVYLVLRNLITRQDYSIALQTDPRYWFSGQEQTIVETVNLPVGISVGEYRLFLNLPDLSSSLRFRPEYSIRLANEETWEPTSGFNSLHHTLIITN